MASVSVFSEFIKLFIDNAALESTVSKEQQFYKLLWEKEVRCTFPNVDVLLRIYLVLVISNCSGERSFSKLKLIRTGCEHPFNKRNETNLPS